MQQDNTKKQNKKSFVPFFVADRQASLRILSGIAIPDGKKFGLMTHANTSENFRKVFKKFPCVNAESCAVIGDKKCPFDENISICSSGLKIKNSLVTMCDSGVFTKDGCGFSDYSDLFQIYEDLSVEYGIIIDYLKDKEKTIKSAKQALTIYKNGKWSFKLIGVAQGVTNEEYIECYKELKKMGYEYIGIGGMLKRRENSARYVHVRDESLLADILSTIRKSDEKGMIFALGCYSPKRQVLFTSNSIFGSDYKGWIFQYSGKSSKRGDKKAQKKRFRQVRRFIETKILSKNQEWERNRLLIISCSKAKRRINGKVRAIDLYDGPLYRLLRKRLSDFSNDNGVDIIILSAKYGLIQPHDKIKYYDRMMTREIAEGFKVEIKEKFSSIMSIKCYDDVLVNLGSNYMIAFQPTLKLLPEYRVKVLRGRIGKRLKATKKWLES